MMEREMNWQEMLFRAYYESFNGSWNAILGPVPAGYRKAQQEKDDAAIKEIMMPYAADIQLMLPEDDLDYYTAKYFTQEPTEEWLSRKFNDHRAGLSAGGILYSCDPLHAESERDCKFRKLLTRPDVITVTAIIISIISLVVSIIG